MNDSYFTSDWHLDHERSLRFEARKGYSTHKELEDKIIDNCFSILKPGDNLYYLGDLKWKSNKDWLDEFFNKFKKKRILFHWVTGNHDKLPLEYRHKALASVSQIKDIVIQKQKITLCHYPMLAWNSSHWGSLNLHGHIHYKDSSYNKISTIPYPFGKQLNVNIELHDWKPWSFEEVKAYMDTRPNNWDFIEKSLTNEL